MQTEKIKTIAATVMMAGACLLYYFSTHLASPNVDSRPQEALGQAMAEEGVKLLGSGGHITLICLDTSTIKNPSADYQVKGFHRALQKAKLTLAATNSIKLDPLRLVRVPAGDFLEIMRKQSGNDVIVSFLGPAVLNAEQRSRLGEAKPRIVALCSGWMPRQLDLRELFAQNLLQVAIISRPAPASSAPSGDPKDWFDHFYQIVMKSNLSELPPLTNSVAR